MLSYVMSIDKFVSDTKKQSNLQKSKLYPFKQIIILFLRELKKKVDDNNS